MIGKARTERRIPCKNGDEFDAFTSWRKVTGWKPGTLKRVKNGYRRRLRKEHRREIEDALEDYAQEQVALCSTGAIVGTPGLPRYEVEVTVFTPGVCGWRREVETRIGWPEPDHL